MYRCDESIYAGVAMLNPKLSVPKVGSPTLTRVTLPEGGVQAASAQEAISAGATGSSTQEESALKPILFWGGIGMLVLGGGYLAYRKLT